MEPNLKLPETAAPVGARLARVFHGSRQCVETCRQAGALTAKLADGKHVFWLDVGSIFLRPDGTINTDLMPDLLHPNLAGAEAWAQAIEPTLARLSGDHPSQGKVGEAKQPSSSASRHLTARSHKSLEMASMETSRTAGVERGREEHLATTHRHRPCRTPEQDSGRAGSVDRSGGVVDGSLV